MRDPLLNISPLDGRYEKKTEELRPFFSESALMRYRLLVEIEWFIFLSNHLKLKGTKIWKTGQIKEIRSLYEYFDTVNAHRIKTLEEQTNHDVKALEYFIKENLKGSDFEPYLEFIHFGCTSEDINNLAYALMLKDSLHKVILPVLHGVYQLLVEYGKKYRGVAMVSRTHGQPATPTTFGKEWINFAARLEKPLKNLEHFSFQGKINGAVGNYNAHLVAYPAVDWISAGKEFIESLGLTANLYTTQIEPHDFLAEIFDILKRINTILIGLNRDIWTYISIGYLKQKPKKEEIGSSTMPHKVNPIDFENSEGNLGLANAFLSYFSEKLPVSRLQRDLTDSTTLRNIGCSMGYSVLAYKNCIQGLHKLEINRACIQKDLDEAWELLAEPVQMVMRKYAVPHAYEQLKTLTRGEKIKAKDMHQFIEKLPLPASEKKRLKNLTPSQYIGLAIELVEKYQPLSY